MASAWLLINELPHQTPIPSIHPPIHSSIQVIGKGAFGKVMMVRVRNDAARRVYAMKVINKAEIIRRGYMDSTKLERAILSGSEHPFIVRLRFAFQNGAKLYLVTDFYNGGNLLVHLKRNCAFPEHAARFFAAEVFLAIEYLHRRRIVYRDLKVRACLPACQPACLRAG
jgi:serine/threonine protein kinase